MNMIKMKNMKTELDYQKLKGRSLDSDSDSDHEFSEPFESTTTSLSYKFYDNSKFTIGAQNSAS